jgi:hypothetical protein
LEERVLDFDPYRTKTKGFDENYFPIVRSMQLRVYILLDVIDLLELVTEILILIALMAGFECHDELVCLDYSEFSHTPLIVFFFFLGHVELNCTVQATSQLVLMRLYH